jgi:arylsulfatase A-like enzyme
MKKPLVILFLMISITALSQQKERPNIIIILADDMGFSDLGCFGSEIPTPNLDKLAQNGIRINQFYNTARCCPTRASLLTGLYAHQAGVGHMTEAIDNNPAYEGYLNKNCVTIGEAMHDAGYFTIMTGKWHVGHKPGQRPADRGFDRSLNSPAGGFYFNDSTKNKLFLNGQEITDKNIFGDNWYTTDLWTTYSLRFIDEAKKNDKPFMLYLAENAPHFPLQAPEADIQKFRGRYMKDWELLRKERYERQIKMGLIDKSYSLTPNNPLIPVWDSLTTEKKKQYNDMMAIYAAVVTHLDKAVGDLVDGLKKRNLFDNTVIIFISDNGGNAEPGVAGMYKGEHPGGPNSAVHIGQCWAQLNNTPFWLYKHHTSEGGIASPFILSWPAGIPSSLNGKILNRIGHVIDIMPTCLELGKGKYPSTYQSNSIQPEEGISLVPIITEKNILRTKPIFWEHEGNRAMRKGKYKIVSNVNEPWQLYDMEKDRTELHDLSALQPQLLKSMVDEYEIWYKKVNAQPYFKEPKRWQYSILDALKDKSDSPD